MTENKIEKYLRECKIENGEISVVEFLPTKDPDPFFGIQLSKVPDICRVVVKLYPTPESDITVELWLPMKEWNEKFLGTGNGGAAGAINTIALINGVSRGYAVANTDMGSSLEPYDLIGKPERWIDFGHRATHLMTSVSKQLIKIFYGKEAKYSYFWGGSTGGQQGLMEAQRYPEDFDGIVAFGPANNRVKLHTSFVWNWKALTQNPNAGITAKEATTITERVVEKYGITSGSAPGDKFISYPDKFKMDLEILNDAIKEQIMKPEQLEALKKVYEGTIDPVTGERIFTPYVAGSENSDLGLVVQSDVNKFAKDFFFIFHWIWGKDFDFTKFDFHHDFMNAMEKLSPILDATDTELSTFRNKGGKIIMITGTADAIIPYKDANCYYEQVIAKQKGLENTLPFFRYFVVPGLGHVFGGVGLQELGIMGLPSVPRDKEHDALSALEAWVENGEVPDRLLPVAFVDGSLAKPVAYERPVYPYPYVTEYVSGDPKKAESFRRA